MPAQPAVIIVKKRRKEHGGHHGGAWKVAYADFVTAMMAFFLVMWLVGQSKPVKVAIGGYFRDPGVFDQQHSNGAIPGGNGGILPDGVAKQEQTSSSREADEQAALRRAAERIRLELEQNPEFRALRDQVEMTITPDGLRIQLLDTDDSSFFDSGSATLKPETERMLQLIGGELKKQADEVAVEGHTDSRPYSHGTTSYGNWELSADRANAARRVMETVLRPKQLVAVRGYADTQPRLPHDPADPRNRRVSIIVRKPSASAAVPDPS